jgi:hypothetical protein
MWADVVVVPTVISAAESAQPAHSTDHIADWNQLTQEVSPQKKKRLAQEVKRLFVQERAPFPF